MCVSAHVHMSFLVQLIVWSDVSKVGYLLMWSVYGSNSSLAGHQPSLDCTVFTSYPLDWYTDRREYVKKRFVICLPFTVNFAILIKWFESSNDNIIIIRSWKFEGKYCFNPLKPELNPICYLLALLAHHFLHVSRIRVKSLTLRLLMSYIYGAPILDVSRSHTTTQHSR